MTVSVLQVRDAAAAAASTSAWWRGPCFPGFDCQGLRWFSGSNCGGRKGEARVFSTDLELAISCLPSPARPLHYFFNIQPNFVLPRASPMSAAPSASWPWRAASRRPSCGSAESGPTSCSSTTRRILQSSAGPGRTTTWKTTKTVINKRTTRAYRLTKTNKKKWKIK